MSEGDQLDAETLLAQLVFILPKPFFPVSTSKAYLKEEVRVALFTMLRKINFEGWELGIGFAFRLKGLFLEVVEGGVNPRYKVGRRSGSPPTEATTEVSR